MNEFCLQLLCSLKHYEGDDRIKMFIYDLISPSEDGQEKDCKNHSGKCLGASTFYVFIVCVFSWSLLSLISMGRLWIYCIGLVCECLIKILSGMEDRTQWMEQPA